MLADLRRSGRYVSETLRRLLPHAAMPDSASREVAVFVLAVCCCVAPLDLTQLILVFIGATCFAAIRSLQLLPDEVQKLTANIENSLNIQDVSANRKQKGPFPRRRTSTNILPHQGRSSRPTLTGASRTRQVHKDTGKARAKPVSPPAFRAQGWDAEVDELLLQLLPSLEGEQVLHSLACTTKRALCKLLPDLEVLVVASGDPVLSTAYGVAVPEVDIVVSLSTQSLLAHAQSRWQHQETEQGMQQVIKSTLRLCTQTMIYQEGFKFRRSSFRNSRPTTTILAPASLSPSGEAVPLSLSVNNMTPIQNAAILAGCNKRDPRVLALFLLVKRWAKDRGICHVTNGHLLPYQWTLLVIYFLQVYNYEESPLLTALTDVELSSMLKQQLESFQSDGLREDQYPEFTTPLGCATSVGGLFRSFFQFYARNFAWKNEVVSIRNGVRNPPDGTLHIGYFDIPADGLEAELFIEDPFDPAKNIGTCMNLATFERLQDEMRRADTLCSQQGSLSALLEPWVPPI